MCVLFWFLAESFKSLPVALTMFSPGKGEVKSLLLLLESQSVLKSGNRCISFFYSIFRATLMVVNGNSFVPSPLQLAGRRLSNILLFHDAQ